MVTKVDSGLIVHDGGTIKDALDAVTGLNGAASVGYQPAGTGAVATTVQSKLRETVSITDFYANGISGAKVDPTGVIDSTAGIQAALNTGKAVLFPDGQYKVTSTLSIAADGQKICGSGYIKSAITDNNVFLISGKSDVEISGITIEAAVFPSQITISQLNAIYAVNCENVSVHDTKIIHKSKNFGVTFASTVNSKIYGNSFTCSDLAYDVLDSGTPASVTVYDGCRRILVENNVIDITGIGINVTNVSAAGIEDVVVNGNTVYHYRAYGDGYLWQI